MQCLKRDVGLLRCLSVPPSNIASAYHSKVSAAIGFVIVNSSRSISFGNILVRVARKSWAGVNQDLDTQEMMCVSVMRQHDTIKLLKGDCALGRCS